MRLCNALLTAEHGDDFLPIDDDRPDRGNDGYLKSERRIFAAHCFKRVQNQGLERDIRAKMVGDLGKAIALKSEGLWPVDAWTFVCNYPIAEAIGAPVLRMGREACIDVSWRGPTYLARTMAKHPELRERFPALHVVEIDEQISAISERLDELAGVDENVSTAAPSGIPTTTQQLNAMRRDRPDYWEYMLFAGFIYQGKTSLEPKWHDHELKLARGVREDLSDEDLLPYLQRAMGELRTLADESTRVFDKEYQEAAFGAPGTDGDPVRIEHYARRLISSYESVLDWAARLRSLRVATPSAGLVSLTADLADYPAQQIRDFLEQAIESFGRLPAYLADPTPDKDDLVINLFLKLDLDRKALKAFFRELKRLERAA